MEIFFDLTLLLGVALIGGIGAYFLRLPLVIGYIISGVVLSLFFHQDASQNHTVMTIADVGVALLMFTLGLEFNLSRLKGLGGVVLLGSFFQIGVTVLFGVLVFPFLGFNFFNSLFMGAVLALSSTAVVVKILSDKGELDTVPGEIAVGWLLVQDLFTLPLIVILPAIGLSISSGSGTFWSFLSFGKAFSVTIALVIVFYLLGRYVLPFLFQKVAEFGVRELLLLSVVLFCFMLSYGAVSMGVSFAIGAFLAGFILSTSLANHAIFAEVRPLRDIFSIVFFSSLGFLLNTEFIVSHFWSLLFLTGLVLFFKFFITSFLVFVFGYHSKISFQVGVSLISVGEFAFVIAVLGASSHIITQDTYMTILSVATFSLILSSPLLSHSKTIYASTRKVLKRRFPGLDKWFHRIDTTIFSESKEMSGHVLVLGHGRVGKYVTNALVSLSIPYLVVDYNMRLVKALHSNGRNVLYGDPSDIDVLQAASVSSARALVIAIPDTQSRDMIISHVQNLNPTLPILCRVHRTKDVSSHTKEHITMVQPEFEASVEITRKLLEHFSVDPLTVKQTLSQLRSEHGF